MMETIKTSHQGEEIEFKTFSDAWYCAKWDYENQSLQKVKAYIDRKKKDEEGPEKFKRFTAIFYKYGEPKQCEVTSLNGDGWCWIVIEGRRAKERVGDIYKMTEQWDSLSKSLEAVDYGIKKLQEERHAMLKGFSSTLTSAF